jgi:uncharacterized membrane protein YgcG
MKTHKMRISWWGYWVALLCLALGVTPALAAKSAQAERYDVDLEVQADGSVRVSETLVFRYSGGPFTFVNREIPAQKTDGLRFIEAGMDGKTLGQGSGAGQVEVSGSDPLTITWHFAGVSDSTHTFTLTYLALGVVEKLPNADVFAYRALPVKHDYNISASTVRVSYPLEAQIQGQPGLLTGKADIQSQPGRATFQARALGADQTLEVRLQFAPGSLTAQTPLWQSQRQASAERNQNSLWLFGALSALILAGGGVGLRLFGQRYRPSEPPLAVSTIPNPVRPSDLAPALANALQSGGEPQPTSRMATLIDLAQRGVLEISELPKKGWFAQQDFKVHLLRTSGIKGHEHILLQALFDEDLLSPGLNASLKTGIERMARAWDSFSNAIRDELLMGGWIDAERRQTQKSWLAVSVGALFLSMLGLVGCIILIDTLGVWVLLVGFSLVLLSIFWLVVITQMSFLTPKGQLEAAGWKCYRAYLEEAAKGHIPNVELSLFEGALAYAAAFGIAHQWTEFFKKQGLSQLPAWFQATDPGQIDNFYYFVDTYSSTGDGSDGGGGGGDGGGSAGGGSSSTG